MQYEAISLENGQLVFNLLQADGDLSKVEGIVHLKGSGQQLDLTSAFEALEEVGDRFGTSLQGPAQRNRFEAEVGIALYQGIQHLPAIADREFWRWAALLPLREYVLTRHQEDRTKLPGAANFGLGGRNENFLYRAWLRAAIAYDSERPLGRQFEIAFRGGSEFWRSHVFRQGYAYGRTFLREFILFQYPTETDRTLDESSDPKDGIRMFVKRIRRFNASCTLSYLNPEQSRQVLEHLAKGLTCADGSIYP